MDNKTLFNKVKRMNLPLGKYALFGSAPMGIKGMRECHDIDLIVTDDLYEEYKNKKGWEVSYSEDGKKYSDGLRRGEIEIWRDWWPGWDVKKLIKEAEIINGLPFVRLEEVVRWKKAIGRKKDLEDVRLIEEFINGKSC